MVEAQIDTTTPVSGDSLSNNSIETKTESAPVAESTSKPTEQIQDSTKTVAIESEKVLKQSEVDKLVGRVKHEAAEKARKEAFLDFQKGIASQPIQQSVNPADIASEVQKQSVLLAQQALARNEAESFMQKVELAKTKYPDFDKSVMQALKIEQLPMPFISMLNSVDNIGDCLKEMADNPTKFTEVMNAAAWNPELGKRLLFKLSDSIKKNEEVVKQPVAPEPLDQLKHSTTGTDNGSLSLKDLKRQPWLRG